MYNAHPSITSPLDRLVHCIAYIYIYCIRRCSCTCTVYRRGEEPPVCVPGNDLGKLSRGGRKRIWNQLLFAERESEFPSYFIYTRIVTILSSSFEFGEILEEILQRILIFSKKKKNKRFVEGTIVQDAYTHTHLEIKFNSRL